MAASVITQNKAHIFSSVSAQLSLTVSGNNRVLLVFVNSYNGVASVPVSTIDFDGVTMTSHATENGFSTIVKECFKLVAPHTGTHNLNISWVTDPNEVLIHAVQLDEVDQTTPLETASSSAGQSTSPSQSGTSVSGELVFSNVFGVLGSSNLTLTDGASQTNVLKDETVDTLVCAATSYKTASGTSTSLSWTIGDNAFYSIMTVGVKNASASGVTVNPTGVSATGSVGTVLASQTPTLSSITPSSVVNNSTTAVKFIGIALVGTSLNGSSPSVNVPGGWTASNLSVSNSTSATFDLQVPASTSSGNYNISYTTTDGTSGNIVFHLNTGASGGILRVPDMSGGLV